MWSSYVNDSDACVSLHDCIANQIDCEGKNIIFAFPEGFTVYEEDAASSVRVASGQMVLAEACLGKVYLFKTTCLLGKELFTRRIEFEPEELIRKVNEGKWLLEFVSRKDSYNTVYFGGYLWENRKKGKGGKCIEFEMELIHHGVVYRWNTLCAKE